MSASWIEHRVGGVGRSPGYPLGGHGRRIVGRSPAGYRRAACLPCHAAGCPERRVCRICPQNRGIYRHLHLILNRDNEQTERQ